MDDPETEIIYTCTCGGLLDIVYDYSKIHITKKDMTGRFLSGNTAAQESD